MSVFSQNVFYMSLPTQSVDETESLVNYLNQHGVFAYKADNDDHAVETPIECPRKEDVAERSATVHTLVTTWRMFWEYGDSGLWGLPVYTKECPS